jgi:hypothetical protein
LTHSASLSAAIRGYVSHKWYLLPISILPIENLLFHDYSLAEGLSAVKGLPLVIFQGTSDTTTPIDPECVNLF